MDIEGAAAACRAKGGKWNEATKTCRLPSPKEEKYQETKEDIGEAKSGIEAALNVAAARANREQAEKNRRNVEQQERNRIAANAAAYPEEETQIKAPKSNVLETATSSSTGRVGGITDPRKQGDYIIPTGKILEGGVQETKHVGIEEYNHLKAS